MKKLGKVVLITFFRTNIKNGYPEIFINVSEVLVKKLNSLTEVEQLKIVILF